MNFNKIIFIGLVTSFFIIPSVSAQDSASEPAAKGLSYDFCYTAREHNKKKKKKICYKKIKLHPKECRSIRSLSEELVEETEFQDAAMNHHARELGLSDGRFELKKVKFGKSCKL